MNRRVWLVINSFIVLVGLLTLWHLSVRWLHVPKYLLPGPELVAAAVVERFSTLKTSMLITAEAAVLGLIGSIAVGVGIALVFAQWRWLRTTALSLYDFAADSADRGDCSFDYLVGGGRGCIRWR